MRRISRRFIPSPAMGVALLALFVALGGTGIAAVNYARKAGKVDGKDAVGASASLRRAAGNLVATRSRGPDRGQIPQRFLDGVPGSQVFGRTVEVVDNATGAAIPLASSAGFGTLTATCADQEPAPGVEDPVTVLGFANTAPLGLNSSRRAGVTAVQVGVQAPGTTETLSIRGSNTFDWQLQNGGSGANLFIRGTVRQDGADTANAYCVFYGTTLRVEP